jgi:hypothetical protein
MNTHEVAPCPEGHRLNSTCPPAVATPNRPAEVSVGEKDSTPSDWTHSMHTATHSSRDRAEKNVNRRRRTA